MANLTADGRGALVLGSIIMLMDIVAVYLRLRARQLKRLSLGADDYWILFAVVLEIVYIGLLFWGIIGGGGGKALTEITIPEIETLLKSEYISDFFINSVCTAVKLSILCLYRRIFDVKEFRMASNIMGGLCLTWYIVTMCFAILLCDPVSAFWTVGPEGPDPADRCIDFPTYFLCVETLNVLLDVLILCLPIRMIWQLHLPARQKILLGSIFLLGGFVCVMGILRVTMTYHPQGQNWNLLLLTDLSILETGVAIICACLPTFRPLLADFARPFTEIKQWYDSRGLSTTKNDQGSASHSGSGSQPYKIHDRFLKGGQSAESKDDTYPLHSIAVHNSVEVYSGQSAPLSGAPWQIEHRKSEV